MVRIANHNETLFVQLIGCPAQPKLSVALTMIEGTRYVCRKLEDLAVDSDMQLMVPI